MRQYAWFIALAVLFLGGILASNRQFLISDQVVTVVDQACDLTQTGCSFNYNDQSVYFSIEPKPILILKPLEIMLESADDASGVENVQVEFEGINMDMGYNLVKLKPLEGGKWRATGMLPACTAETMHWFIKVFVSGKAGVVNFRFRLTTSNS